MTRFQPTVNPLLQAAVFLSMAAVFWVDLLTPLGIAVWIFYLVPIALTLWARRPGLPLVVAGLATVLIVIGFYVSPPAVELGARVAAVNRTFGAVTVWILAFVARTYVLANLAVVERDWVRDGQRLLSARIQGDLSTEEVAQRALSMLAEYTDGAVGAVYAAEGDETFRLVARHAADPSLPPPERVRRGDSLVGEAIRQRRATFLEDVPADALPVRSSFGRGAPRHLAVVPLAADGAVVGALELGYLRAIGRAERDLLEGVAEALGVALRSARYRAQLQDLLAETQRQQEELRVTNEELEEQSNALRESQARLESQQAELEQTNTQLEEQAEVLERQRDDLARAQQEARATAADLARASRYKSEFMANMSHELRTPLNSTLILAKLLADNKDGNLTAEQVEYARTILSAGQDLLALVNDVLDVAKIEAGQLQLRMESLSTQRLVDSLARAFKPVADEKGLVFDARLEPDAPARMTSDPQRLEQILRNLLSNAIKFTERGQVTLRVSSPGPERVRFEVRDTGIGIPADKLDLIFEAFRQVDGSTHRKYGGTGLGLSISRDLARRLGGDVRVNSKVGQGSAFSVDLPLDWYAERAVPDDARRPSAGGADAPGARSAATGSPAGVDAELPPPAIDDDRGALAPGDRSILIVEDDLRFARLLVDVAREQRFRAVVATSAADGVELARRFRPSAVVLDMNLPEESGLTVLESLKRETATRHIPVHVVSVADYTRLALEMGAVGYALKPVQREQLVEALRRLEQRLDQTVHRLLVVEDSGAEREQLRALLGGEDVEIVEVGTAAEALDRLRATTFDCMVLDLGLPDTSGYELLDRMAESAAYSFPPVIVYTARSITPAEELRLRRYSSSIVIKGAHSPERLLDEVALFMHRVESKLPPDRQRQLREARRRDEVLDGRRILVVEDDVRNVFALTSILEARGARVAVARNGREALAALERAGADRPDLVLMDLMMPEMDGLTATREIRSRPGLQDLPIIALTAKAMSDDRQRCLDAGANDYISKPIDVERLLSLLRVWVRR